MKKLKIYVLTCDLNEEFYLDLQIKSYKKFVESDQTEFIVVNNSKIKRDLINEICLNNQIKTIQVDDYKKTRTNMYYQSVSSRNCQIPPYDWLIQNELQRSNDYILLIHPDMFFINKIDYIEKLKHKKIYFVPRYHEIFYMWEGVILFDAEYLNSQDLTKYLDFSVGEYLNQSDYSKKLIENMRDSNPNTKKIEIFEDDHIDQYYSFLEMWTLHNFERSDQSIRFDACVNGCARHFFDDRELNPRWEGNGELRYHDRTFPYEKHHENYKDYFTERIIDIYKMVESFPKPIEIDLINFFEDSEYSFFHFKSGSGYQNYFNEDYLTKKMQKVKEFIEKN